MKANVYSMEGEVKEEIELPAIFNEEYRPDLIKGLLFQHKPLEYNHGVMTLKQVKELLQRLGIW